MEPNISIIVPIYNAEKYMKKCINSILSQTLKNIEIILVNDGSLDNSANIADEYSRVDRRVRVIHQNNSGPSVARNTGISVARGKYIGFVDSDDYIEKTMYEELFKSADKNNVQVAMCSYIENYTYKNESHIIKANLKPGKIYDKSGIQSNIINTFAKNENYGFYSLWNKIYLREWLIKSNLKMDESRDHGEDWWFNINVFSKIDTFIYIDKELYNYIHINSNSLMSKYRENQFELFLDGRLKMKEIMPIEYIEDNDFNKRFVYEFSSYIIRTLKEIDNKKRRKELINNVLNNEEVNDCCKNVSRLPIHFKITTWLMKYKLKCLTLLTYKVISILV